MTQKRTPSAIDAVAEDYVDRSLALSPSLALYLGLDGAKGFDDYSPAGLAAINELTVDTLEKLAEAEKTAELDDIDRVTVDAMRDRLGVDRDYFEAGIKHASLNVIASPLQDIRDAFDLMPTETTEHWESIDTTLAAVPNSVSGYRESLSLAKERGRVSARIQVEKVIEQARALAEAGSNFDTLIAGAAEVPASLRDQLGGHAEAARASFAELADFLASELLPAAPENEACGREAYALYSRDFLGAEVDFDETYAWGLEELARIDAQQRQVAEKIAPGKDLFEVMALLNKDPERTLHGSEALRDWMQTVADEAITELGKSHFDIPEPVRTIECMIAPSATGGIYYTGPTDDFSRPGRMWWSVPEGVTEFATWQEKTTVYHEGVPGHHLQVGQATYVSDTLNRWRRLMCWVSGHGEGWALYAEKLMADLGFMDEPGDYLGMLDSQRLRAARVVLDIGFHLGLEAPASLGGGIWNREKAWQFLTDNVAMDRSFLAFELDRYLGWPGQAPSYKIGQRLWEQFRDEAKAEAGADFDLKAFHTKALNLGSVGLDTLGRAIRR
ncbi:DUF885 domain-containing protein [Brevibacterium sp. GP-SGM9]|uniref:DUF885 domain-containing protein n=1 Tax=unclassified Brevibacterium TaxID=2614124 RepID=UPI001E33041A|nr:MULTISPECIES: DUF885 domain-containing protein [unclassified Brevibacterium]MCD1284408.1 DUF885 domain-containing protein [Brevibacterium sp. CCUG 69071]MDK8435979.1 DUF885 domain-containing protein [Brevibacterium sp. H-BE7]